MQPRIIGICGLAYSGSSLLARLFSAVPGVGSPGEVVYRLFVDPPQTRWCRSCGEGCPVMTDAVVNSIVSPGQAYPAMAEHLDVDTLVVAEKDPSCYEMAVEPKTMDAILLFKEPLQAVASRLRRREATVDEALARWTRFYGRMHREWCPTFCRKTVYVSYEELASQPQATMDRLCDALELPKVKLPENLRAINHHAIGGSLRAMRATQAKLDDRWRFEVSPAKVIAVRSNSAARDLHKAMLSRAVTRQA